ncbi:hypothetical protein AWZ03_014252 [Drosophila navojoa]|uniref:Uncharacterized protein n=1 Tax=Drosophila navojoa TaxID=7232 RepID=A0A484AS97_DRONA|nr:hypothetical protein AWZ03_014252 [Drosophila navojoa]
MGDYLLNKNANSSAAGDDSEQGHGQDSKHESSSSSSSSSVASFASPTSQPSSQQAAAAKAMPNRNSNPELNLKPNASLIRSMSLALTSGVQCIEFQFETSPDIRTPPPTGGATPTISGTAFTFSGSVTKMTLKDNHLIVVTEERHDISRNARETKMHTDKDGVFVVEVARGIDSKQPPDSPAAGVDITELPFDTSNKLSALEERSLPPSHEQVQIHAPPSDFANQPAAVGVGAAAGLQLIEEEQLLPDEEHDTDRQQPIQSQTGLSQSDLSSTSSSDSNKRYSYGNQELYVIEQPGYANDSPMVLMSQLESGAANASERMPEQQEPQQQQEQQEQREQQEQQEQQKQQEQKEQQMPQEQQEQQEQQEEQEQPVPAPAAFGNDNETVAEQVTVNVEEAKEQQAKEEPENNYDSLMSLPAPPSTEEIKEFNDFTLMESNQLDSLPPPPPPLSEPAIGNGHQHDEDAEQEEQEEQEEQQQKELEEQLAKEQELEQEQEQELEQEQEPKQQLKLANGKICAPPNTAEHTNGTGTGQEQPSTLTPPASPPASPSAATLCAGSLANGIHAVPQPMVVDVNGS